MKIGTLVPQGWVGEYDGWDPLDAWRRTVRVAQEAERLGFESVWLFDHFHTIPRPTDEITFESFTSLSALAALTNRVRLGHVVTSSIGGSSTSRSITGRSARTLSVTRAVSPLGTRRVKRPSSQETTSP